MDLNESCYGSGSPMIGLYNRPGSSMTNWSEPASTQRRVRVRKYLVGIAVAIFLALMSAGTALADLISWAQCGNGVHVADAYIQRRTGPGAPIFTRKFYPS